MTLSIGNGTMISGTKELLSKKRIDIKKITSILKQMVFKSMVLTIINISKIEEVNKWSD